MSTNISLRLVVESSTTEAVAIESAETDEAITAQGTAITVSQLNLVDLAGSERADQTGAVGM